MRIVAATLIVLHHYQQGTGVECRYISFYGGKFNFGYVVELFFVISGLLAYENVRSVSVVSTLRDFWGGRVRRIVPLLAISVVIEAILIYIDLLMTGGAEYPFGLLDILVNALGLNWGIFQTKIVNQPTWYISVLLICHLKLYIVVQLSNHLKVNANYSYVLMILIGIAANTYGWSGFLINMGTGRGMVSFFTGVLLAQYLRQSPKCNKEGVLIVLPVLFLLSLKYYHKFVESGSFVFYTLFIWVPIVVLAIRHIPRNFFGAALISVLGRSSYGVYLWNEPLAIIRNILAMITGVNLRIGKAMIGFVICNWIVGVSSYFLFERPIGRALEHKEVNKGREKVVYENT